MALEDVAWPEQLTLATRWRRLDNGGAADIREWAGTVAKPRLVILDTLAELGRRETAAIVSTMATIGHLPNSTLGQTKPALPF